MNHYINCFRRYVDFEGRSSRAEFWWFQIINALISLMLAYLTFGLKPREFSSGVDGINWFFLVVNLLYSLGAFLPALAVLIRRLHDIGKSGFWVLFSLVPLVGAITVFVFTLLPPSEGGVGVNNSKLSLGLGARPLSSEEAACSVLGYGLKVTGVFPRTPAATAGLMRDDLIVTINGAEARTMESLKTASKEKTLTLGVIRLGQRREFQITL